MKLIEQTDTHLVFRKVVDIVPHKAKLAEGALMTLERFEEAANEGSLADYDGHGCLATDTHVSNWRIYPSEAWKSFPEVFTHVTWYNK